MVMALPVKAAESIAVVVNDDAISMSDLNDRLRLIMISSGFPDKKEIKERLLPQIVASLVDEQLMMQEARKEDINITPMQIEKGFQQIAAQNNTTVENFQKNLRKSNINPKTLERQIAAQIGWSKVIQKKIPPAGEYQ